MLTFPFLLLCCGLLVSAQEKYARVSATHHERDTVSCADNGFCDSGKYCAPVAGYCCLEGEDLETCARNAGFTLPGSAPNASSAVPQEKVNVTTVASPTLTVLPFLKESPKPTPIEVDIQNSSCSFNTPSNLNKPIPVPTTVISHTNKTTSPAVQVSLGVKRAESSTGSITLLSLMSVLAVVLLDLVISPR
ncbi:hypothetical protein F5Y11DRAFT_348074 [Daldinia sp. FL1419]|nr:hypothetical protein F5Y11DRAFT_348074 [Daldinia sp. FL1419]